MAPSVNNTGSISNKDARSKALKRYKHLKIQDQLARRAAQRKAEAQDPSLRDARIAANPPRTIEGEKKWLGDEQSDGRTRPVGVEIIKAAPDVENNHTGVEEEIKLDMGSLADLFASYPDTEGSDQPLERLPILLTTSPRPSVFTLAFARELAGMFGGSRHVTITPRKTSKFQIGSICKWAAGRGFGCIVILGEDQAGRNRSGPTHLTICRLPFGPTAHFRLTAITPGKAIKHHANPTNHFPELVLSNFSTPLGLSIGRLLQSVFPPLPDLEGRQVVSVQNQRDFIFFRRFRYAFAERDVAFLKADEETIRTRLQEIGPRFTLKLRYLKRGTLAGGINVNVQPGHEGSETTLFDAEKQKEGSKVAREQYEATRKGKQRVTEVNETMEIVDEEIDNCGDEAADPIENSEMPPEQDAPIVVQETIPVHNQPDVKTKKKRKRRPNSSGIHEKFLNGDSDSDSDGVRVKPRRGGGLGSYMNDIQDRLNGQGKKKRQVEWEWKARMGKDRKTFFL